MAEERFFFTKQNKKTKNMYYQGENIKVSIKSDSVTNLNGRDFKLLAYPHFERNNAKYIVTLNKKDFTPDTVGDVTTFSGDIPYTKTALLPTGDYDIEVLVKESETFRSIFLKTFAFALEFANSKNH